MTTKAAVQNGQDLRGSVRISRVFCRFSKVGRCVASFRFDSRGLRIARRVQWLGWRDRAKRLRSDRAARSNDTDIGSDRVAGECIDASRNGSERDANGRGCGGDRSR